MGDVVRVPDHAHRLATNKVVQQFYGEGGDAIRFGLGSVWLSNLRAGERLAAGSQTDCRYAP